MLHKLDHEIDLTILELFFWANNVYVYLVKHSIICLVKVRDPRPGRVKALVNTRTRVNPSSSSKTKFALSKVMHVAGGAITHLPVLLKN